MTQTQNTPQDKTARAKAQALELYQQGVTQHRAGQLDAADELYRQAIAYDARLANAIQMRGVVQLQKRNPEEAAKLIQRAVDLEPNNGQALNNLGNALIDLKRYDEAIEILRRATELQPNSPDALANYARSLKKRRYFKEAAEAYGRAVEFAPDRPGLISSYAVALTEAGQYEDGLKQHERALALAPDRADLRNNLAHAHWLVGERKKAEEAIREAVAIDPNGGEYHLALGRLLSETGRIDESLGHYREARDNGSQSTRFELALMFYQNHVLDNDPRQALVDARLYAARRTQGYVPFAKWDNLPTTGRRLRIGWVSPDFKSHPVGRFLDGMMSKFDPSRVELFAYSQEDHPRDAIYQSIKGAVQHFRSVSNLTDLELANLVRKDRIDILVDCTGHTANNRLGAFAYKPAPVSVTWLGYFATTGIDQIDYVLCNRWLVPESEEDQWGEKPWRLPDTHWCYTVPKSKIDVVPTPSLESEWFTFGSYNNFEKINDATVKLWSRAVNAVPNSRLWLRSSLNNPRMLDVLKEKFAAEGLEGDRLTLDTNAKNYDEHMASYGVLDIALDPFPYNGGTTTTESLYMGVPVLTLHGDRFVAHLAETNLQSAKLPDWVAKDGDDFVAIAKRWADDKAGLNALRLGLRDRVLASPLFDAAQFCADMADAFEGMWQVWCDQQSAPRKSS